METSSQNEKLTKYSLENQAIFTGFASYQDAENYAQANNGKIVETAFRDGNDNPEIVHDAGLIQNKNHFHVEAGSEYQFIHSADPRFREYADQLQVRQADLDKLSPEEKYITNGQIEVAEDPIIVLKNNEFESVTSRERSKYLKQANVYEIGVSIPV
jgi:hypothetical protein